VSFFWALLIALGGRGGCVGFLVEGVVVGVPLGFVWDRLWFLVFYFFFFFWGFFFFFFYVFFFSSSRFFLLVEMREKSIGRGKSEEG